MSFTRTATDLDALVASGDKFGCIYADPPWKYDDQGVRGAAAKHYDCMTVDEICALPIRDLAADDAHLHLWVTNAFLFDAFRIFDAWDFSFRSTFAWCKPTMGIGHYWRNSHELMLTAIRGNDDGFNAHEMLRSWAIMPRGKHSSKPERVRHMIERASKGPYLELFGRWPTQGWTVWGTRSNARYSRQPTTSQRKPRPSASASRRRRADTERIVAKNLSIARRGSFAAVQGPPPRTRSTRTRTCETRP